MTYPIHLKDVTEEHLRKADMGWLMAWALEAAGDCRVVRAATSVSWVKKSVLYAASRDGLAPVFRINSPLEAIIDAADEAGLYSWAEPRWRSPVVEGGKIVEYAYASEWKGECADVRRHVRIGESVVRGRLYAPCRWRAQLGAIILAGKARKARKESAT
jgi:hypothetical protein